MRFKCPHSWTIVSACCSTASALDLSCVNLSKQFPTCDETGLAMPPCMMNFPIG